MKNINWKALLFDKCEVVVLALIGVFVLYSVGTAKWSTYERMPEEFTDAVKKGRAAFGASRWTEENQKDFEAENVGDKVNLVMNRPAAQEFSTRWVWPMNKRKEKIREPEYRMLLEPVADAGRILLKLEPEQPNTPGGVGVVLANADEVKAAEAKRANGGNGAIDVPRAIEGPRVDGPRQNATTPGNALAGPDLPGENSDIIDGDTTNVGNMAPGVGPTLPGITTAGQAQGSHKAEGRYFVAFRAVFPMKEQVDKFRQALNLETNAEAMGMVQFDDIEIERQTATEGDDPWSGKWEKVDLNYAIDLLTRTEFDIAILSDEYLEAVMSMPLPYRVTGNWKRARGINGLLASHPRISQLLTDEQAREEERKKQALIETAKKEEELQKTKKKGFATVQHDTKSYQSAVNNNAGLQANFQNSYNNLMGMSSAKGGATPTDSGSSMQGMPNMAMMNGTGQAQNTKVPELLLLRFFDFEVVPGNAYRYRARLRIKNPNFQRDASELLDHTSREGEFRHTKWSDASNPVIVKDELEMYVKSLKKSKNETLASIDVFQWMKETGSYVQGAFQNLRPGDQIAAWKSTEEPKKSARRSKKTSGVTTLVLRPLEQSYAEETIDYVTPKTLVDAEQTMILDPGDYPELNLGTKRIQQSLDSVVVLNRFGELETHNNASSAGRYQAAQRLMAQQESVWSSLREKSKAAAQPAATGINALLSGDPDAGPNMAMDPSAMMSMGSGGRASSSTKRRPSGSGGGYGAPMMQGSGSGSGSGYPQGSGGPGNYSTGQ